MPKRARVLLFLLLAALAEASAFTVGLVLVEDESTPSGPGLSALIASGALDVLFEGGQMGVGASVASASDSSWARPGFGLIEAREGYVDFLIAILVRYRDSAARSGLLVPAKVAWRLVRVSDGSVLGSGTIEGPEDSPELPAAIRDRSSQLGRSLAVNCLSLIDPLRHPGGKP